MEELKSYYNEKSKNYDETFSMLGYRVYDTITWKYLEPYIPTNPESVVLDAGGGTGRWALRMVRKGCKVVLLDASEGMLKVAVEKVKQEDLTDRITIKKGELARISYGNESFDMAFCEQTLFLFQKPDVLLKELNRVLKKGAFLVISAQNLYAQCLASLSDKPSPDDVDKALSILQRRTYSFMAKDGKVKIYTWTPLEFIEMLKRTGFNLEKIVGKGVTMPLRISKEVFMKKIYPEKLFHKILKFELAMCERPDALALAGHLQAIARKA